MKKISLILSLVAVLSACSSNDKAYDASGIFEATEVIVSAESNGRIIHLNLTEGQEVEPSEVLGIIDTSQLFWTKKQLLQNKSQAGSRRQNIATQIAATQEQLAYQQREKQRMQNLIAVNAGNTKQLDDIDAQIFILQKQLSAQKENLEQNNQGVFDSENSIVAQIEQLNDQLSKAYIRSPIHGTILNKYSEKGEVAGVGTPLFKVADIGHLYLRAYVTADQFTQIKIGQKVNIFSDFGKKEQRTYNGQITWVASEAEFTPKTIQTKDERANLVYAVKIQVKNDGYLKIGMYGDVKF